MSIKKVGDMSDKSLTILKNLTGRSVTLGSFLWSIRECEEFSQVEFAKLLGVSKQYLCDIENGRRVVSVKAAAEFAAKLNYSAKHFVRLALQDELNKAGLHFAVEIHLHKQAA